MLLQQIKLKLNFIENLIYNIKKPSGFEINPDILMFCINNQVKIC